MSKGKQYRAKLKSKHNHTVRWTGSYYNTFKGAKAEAEKQRLKQKFENDLYTEIEVLLMETRLVTTEVSLNKKCPLTHVECYRENCEFWTTIYGCVKREALLAKVRSEPF